ncbi:NitT/TauT family transport system ATP-binding protein [Ochrobactrum sp. RH1CCR137]|nr:MULTISPECIES: ABC transporter ATP-binding protein [unclassified Ochrobactrum]MBA8846376.1 NitT/TauT family transport system ATP-binding protein [Ochrobactrum sp. RH1CCR137]MBA8858254.1 NitT/TauT family transport system ATP-binding protein [Ochrobactrum sp. RH1CCR134]
MSAEPSRIQVEETRKTAIALKDVQISFKLADGGRFDAVAESNLEVAENEFVAIVGPTGCGKSTLLNAVAGLLVPASGTVEISGQRLQGLNRKAGYLFQQDALMPWKTVLDNVAIGLEIAGTPKAQAREQAREWLARVGLASFGDRYPHMLSGGQRKRVGLAQVLIRNPKYLLMDEPFGPLDAQTRVIMGDLLLDLWSHDRKAVMFVTHDLEEAIALADRVVIMSAGPRARIMAEYKIPLARPREISEIRLDDKFHEIHREIWSALKEEVLKGYQQTSGEKK